MVQAGMLAAVAIDKVYAAYRENQSVTNILCQMQRDKARRAPTIKQLLFLYFTI
jgi:hypothetical protein